MISWKLLGGLRNVVEGVFPRMRFAREAKFQRRFSPATFVKLRCAGWFAGRTLDFSSNPEMGAASEAAMSIYREFGGLRIADFRRYSSDGSNVLEVGLPYAVKASYPSDWIERSKTVGLEDFGLLNGTLILFVSTDGMIYSDGVAQDRNVPLNATVVAPIASTFDEALECLLTSRGTWPVPSPGRQYLVQDAQWGIRME